MELNLWINNCSKFFSKYPTEWLNKKTSLTPADREYLYGPWGLRNFSRSEREFYHDSLENYQNAIQGAWTGLFAHMAGLFTPLERWACESVLESNFESLSPVALKFLNQCTSEDSLELVDGLAKIIRKEHDSTEQHAI